MALNFANNNSLSAITTIPASISGGGLNLISTQTASSSSSLSFTTGIDSTYKEYVFKFYNIHGSAVSSLIFNGSIDSGSNYNVTKTSTVFKTFHDEADTATNLSYDTGSDLAQSTAYQELTNFDLDIDNDTSAVGTLQIFNPSDTTYVKHFIATITQKHQSYTLTTYVAGYFNTISAINAIDFKMSSGNIDSGVIKLYGVS